MPLLLLVVLTLPHAALTCRGCNGLPADPRLSTVCGHTFCRACISKEDACCSVDSSGLSLECSVPNIAVARQIDALLVYCRFAKYDLGACMAGCHASAS